MRGTDLDKTSLGLLPYLYRTCLLCVIYTAAIHLSVLASARRVQLDKPPRVGFAMFSRPPVVKGSVLQREAELLGDVAGADVVIVDEMVDTANTLLRVAAVLKVMIAEGAGARGRHRTGARKDARRLPSQCH